jgi:hypothetical protein
METEIMDVGVESIQNSTNNTNNIATDSHLNELISAKKNEFNIKYSPNNSPVKKPPKKSTRNKIDQPSNNSFPATDNTSTSPTLKRAVPQWSDASEGRYEPSLSTGVWAKLTPILKKRKDEKNGDLDLD